MADGRPPPRVGVDRVLQPAPRVQREGTRLVVSLRGEQDMNTAGMLAAVLLGAAADGDDDLVVDLSQVEFMDAKIIMVLVRGREALKSQARDLVLRAPSPFARRILGLCGLLDLVGPTPAIALSEPGPGVTVGATGVPAVRSNGAEPAFPRVVVPPLQVPTSTASSSRTP